MLRDRHCHDARILIAFYTSPSSPGSVTSTAEAEGSIISASADPAEHLQ
jgi:hypothetical protein